MLTLTHITEALTGKRPPLAANITFNNVVIDSRQAAPGSLFVALPGERHDGHEFLADALARGASGALIKTGYIQDAAFVWNARSQEPPMAHAGERRPICIAVEDTLAALQRIAAYWRGQYPACQVIGVTGSLGKTTTKELVAAVIGRKFRTLKSLGNYNNEIGLPLTLLQLTAEHQRAVLEMSMYALGEIALLAQLAQPRVGVITNVQPIHLERLGSLERIAQAKSELVQALPADGAAILNGDDPLVRAMGAISPARQVLYYGLRPENDLWADHVVGRGLSGIALRFHWQGQTIPAELPLLGAHSVWTALAAAATGLVEGMSWEEIIAALAQPGKPVRLVVARGIQGATLLDDSYNAGPASTVAALDFLASLEGRRIAVLGDMLELGEGEEDSHRLVGRKAAHTVDRLITVGPRARWIAEAAQTDGLVAGAVAVTENNQQAIEQLKQWIKRGDILLIKGSRGMKMEEIVNALREENA